MAPYEHSMSLFPLRERDLGSNIAIFLGSPIIVKTAKSGCGRGNNDIWDFSLEPFMKCKTRQGGLLTACKILGGPKKGSKNDLFFSKD